MSKKLISIVRKLPPVHFTVDAQGNVILYSDEAKAAARDMKALDPVLLAKKLCEAKE